MGGGEGGGCSRTPPIDALVDSSQTYSCHSKYNFFLKEWAFFTQKLNLADGGEKVEGS